MSDQPDVTVMRLDPPRFQRFERSGGLKIQLACGEGRHIWFTMRGVEIKPDAKCACGAVAYKPATAVPTERSDVAPAPTAFLHGAPNMSVERDGSVGGNLARIPDAAPHTENLMRDPFNLVGTLCPQCGQVFEHGEPWVIRGTGSGPQHRVCPAPGVRELRRSVEALTYTLTAILEQLRGRNQGEVPPPAPSPAPTAASTEDPR